MKDDRVHNLQQSGGIARYRRVVIQDVVPVSSVSRRSHHQPHHQQDEGLEHDGRRRAPLATHQSNPVSHTVPTQRASDVRLPTTDIRTSFVGHTQIAMHRSGGRIHPIRRERVVNVPPSARDTVSQSSSSHQTVSDDVPEPGVRVSEVLVSTPKTRIDANQSNANTVFDNINTPAHTTQITLVTTEKRSYYDRVRASNRHTIVGYGLAVVAVVLLLVGIGVNVWSFLVTQQVRAQDTAPNSAYSEEKPTAQATQQYTVAPDLPKYLRIDDIAVLARVLRVGVDTQTSAIGVPGNIFDTAWYDGSAKPGESGTVFIDGHVSGPTQDGVFKQLNQLHKGAKISLTTGNDKQYTYTVTAVEQYDVSSINMTTLLGTYAGEQSGLVLMTCSGAYDQTARTFANRLVVFATQE